MGLCSSEERKGQVCLVTGASGYIASTLVQQLCEQGYTVRGTVRSLQDSEKVASLTGLCPSNPPELFAADLLQEGSFNQAMAGVEILFHTASPFVMQCDDPQTQLIDPAVKGTQNVINEAIAAGVKNIVLTSSVAAVTDSKNFVPPEGYIFDEKDWNTHSTIENNPYPLSKTLAEKAAWELVEKADGVKMKTINPAFVIGPVLSARTDATSIKVVKGMLEHPKGEKASPACFGVVDVRDVAKAHIQAALYTGKTPTRESARYLVSSETSYTMFEMADMMRDEYGAKYSIPTVAGDPPKARHQRSVKKARDELGIDFIPPEKSFNDMAESLIRFNLVSPAATESGATKTAELTTAEEAPAAGGPVPAGRMAEIKTRLDELQAGEPANPRGRPSEEEMKVLQEHSAARVAYEATLTPDELEAAKAAGLYIKGDKNTRKKDKKKGGTAAAATPAAAQPGPAKEDGVKKGKAKKGKAKEAAPAKEVKEPTAEELAKAAAKKEKVVVKEGGKKGVEIEGACDMGGMQFFCTQLDEPDGDMDLLEKGFAAMNAEADPTEEERKGGAGNVGKVVFSAGSQALLMICNVPEDKLTDTPAKEEGEPPMKAVAADQWLKSILGKFAKEYPGAEILPGSCATFAKCSLPANEEKRLFPVKLKDDAMQYAYAYLNEKNCMPADDDDDDDYIPQGDFQLEDY